MMDPTPETLPRHELVGLDVEVVAASNPDAVGIEGQVVTETTKTLGIEGADRVWHVPKEHATFRFELPSATAGTDGVPDIESSADSEAHRASETRAGSEATRERSDAKRVRVDGSTLVARPARRTERTGDSQWR